MASIRLRAGLVAASLAATTLVAAPASALESYIKNDVCTFTLSAYEQDRYDAGQAEANTIDEGSVLRFEVKKADAAKFKKQHESKLRDLEYKREQLSADLGVGALDDETVKKYKADIAVIDSITAVSADYKNALDACAKGESYKPTGKPDTGTGKDSDPATSSNMTDQEKTILWSLLGVAIATTIAYVLQDLPAKLPNLPKFF